MRCWTAILETGILTGENRENFPLLSSYIEYKAVFFQFQVLVKKLQKEIVHLKNELAMHDTLVRVIFIIITSKGDHSSLGLPLFPFPQEASL